MYLKSICGESSTSLRSLRPAGLPFGAQARLSGNLRRTLRFIGTLGLFPMLLLVVSAMDLTSASAQPAPPASDRITINLSAGVPTFVGNAATTDPSAALPQSNWWYENNQDSATFAETSYSEVAAPSADTGPSCGSTISTPNWQQVGIPTDANIWRTFINQSAGGGQGSLCGQNNWYRLHFKVDPTYANSKILIEFEGAHTAAQVYINGTLLPGISAVTANAEASHVVGFVPFLVDLTPYIKADGATDNVLAVSVSRGNSWFEDPQFSEVFRFGQAMAGLFRPVKMFITNKVHIPANIYSNQKTWGTYVATVSATTSSAVIQVETNILNENTTSQSVTLTTQIVDASGNVVATGTPITQTVAAMTPGNFPSTSTPMFSQQITVNNPTLWYPNNSIYGKPYMYTVNHIVSVNGAVVDVAQTPLGIRTITWDANYPYFNGHMMNLWGGSGRYDYPGLGSSVPEEQQWRDLALLAAEGGNVYRPGHSTSSEEFVNAADAYGIMIDQPSGDNEEAFAAAGDPTPDMVTLKEELHRDMIIRDRSHPSILDWESNNGTMEESIGTALLSINSMWDPINTRVAADRTPDNVNGYLLGCTLEGCEIALKETTNSGPPLNQNWSENPWWGAEYWGTGTARGLAWNYEIAFVAPFLNNWSRSKAASTMGMAQWYLADTPGETGQYVEAGSSTTAPGNSNSVRSLGASSMDQNRLPKLLYYAYEAAWVPFSIKPVVHLAGHWNLSSGNVQVNVFSNCPSVELLVNQQQQGAIETPNPWTSDDSANETETDTLIPMQASWIVPWVSGTVVAECLNSSGAVVATDSRTTAGAESQIVLTVVPEVERPNGSTFEVTANGSDAAFVTATIEDASGNWEPLASDNITFSVTGPATYQGGTQQYISTNTDAYSTANSTLIGGVPDAFYHSPGDPELQAEGGMTRIALRSQFTAGTVTVTATAPGLASGSVSFPIVAVPDPRTTTTSCTAVPSAPLAVTPTVDSSSVITLNWAAENPPLNCSITSYNVYSSTTSGFTPSANNLIGSSGTNSTYVAGNLAGSTKYYFVVEAVDSEGSSAASSQVAATTPATPVCTAVPPEPAGLTPTVSSSSAISLSWNAVTPPSGCTISSYTVYGGTTANPTTLLATVTSGTTYTNTGLAPSTLYYYVVKAVDSDGSSAGASTSATTPALSGAAIVSIDAGGAAVSDSGGGDNSFVADEDYTGGSTYSVTNAITIPGAINAIAAPAAVYQSARQGASTYTIPGLTSGTSYNIRLHFAELYFSAAGGREFDVAINGTTVLTNFDIFAAAGANYTAVVEQFTATANSSGQIVIAFTTGALDQPIINGIEVLGTSTGCSAVPSTPTNFAASATSSSVIGLSWTAVTPPANCTISSYSVYGGTSANPTTLIASVTSGTTYTNTGLAASTLYYYLVKAVDSDGASTAATAQTATLANTSCTSVPPTGPTNLTATGPTSSSLSLSWTAAPANPPCTITSYSVYRSTSNGFTPSPTTLDASGVTSTTYTDTGLAASTTYYYLVEALDSFGTSAASNQATNTTLSVSSGASIVSIDAGGAAVSDSGGGDNSFVADEDYTGGGTYSVTNTITIPSSVSATAAPAAVYQSARQGVVTYTIPGLTSGTSYNVRLHFAELYFSAAGGREFDVAINGTTVLTNFDIYATAGANYTAVVKQFTASANSSGQIVIAFTNGAVDQPMVNGIEVLSTSTACSAVPATPTNFTATATSSSAIGLSWSAVTPPANCTISSYSVYGGTSANPTTLIASVTSGTTYTNTGLAASTLYYYLVKAVDSDGASTAAAAQTTTQANTSCSAVPSAPTALTATASSSSAIALSWTAVTPPANCTISSYSVYGGTTANPTTVIASGVTGTTYNNTGLAASTTYYYLVKAVDADGTSAASNQATQTTDAASTSDFIAINSGGPAVSNSGGGDASFAADEDVTGGGTDTSGNTVVVAGVANAAPMAVYQSERAGTFTYTIPGLVAGSQHTVLLHFAETYFTAAGKRVFNVAINGSTVLSNFDIYATVGANKALVEQFTATANSSGQIVISYTNGTVDQPKSSGIEIR